MYARIEDGIGFRRPLQLAGVDIRQNQQRVSC